MDDHTFDRFARALSGHASRRRVLGLLAAAVAAWRPRPAAALSTTCDAGLSYCESAGGCVDLQSDLNNCGACGSVCESNLVPVDCRGGECVRANCPVGIEYCGIADGCRDLSSDPAHCGACGNACASGVCTAGVCGGAEAGGCPPGQADCGGVCIDTCCDNANCGACGVACPAGMTCFEGKCDCPSGLCCAEGEQNCDGTCVATCCDNANCGACGNVCPRGQTCFEGKCGCPSGLCLPNTGVGPMLSGSERGPWPGLAVVSAAASALAWRTRVPGIASSIDRGATAAAPRARP